MPVDFEEFLFSARSFDEYVDMFDLAPASMAGMRILDCPAGAASFSGEAAVRGIDVVALDPLYSRPPAELGELAIENVVAGNDFILENPSNFDWGWFSDPDDHLAKRIEAARIFGERPGGAVPVGVQRRVAGSPPRRVAGSPPRRVAGSPPRRVAGALPRLPFASGSFDLTLSSHLLFTYADRLSTDFHVEAIAELLRVSRGEVRIFPLVSYQMKRYPGLDSIRRSLDESGIATEVRRVAYEFQIGGDEMLVAVRTTDAI